MMWFMESHFKKFDILTAKDAVEKLLDLSQLLCYLLPWMALRLYQNTAIRGIGFGTTDTHHSPNHHHQTKSVVNPLCSVSNAILANY